MPEIASRSRIPALIDWLIGLPGLVLLALLLRWPLLHLPLERDEGAYGAVAWLWRQGYVPYRDVFDHKPPLIYLLYAVPALGDPPHVATLRLWATAWFCLGIVLVYAIGMTIGDRPTAVVAALIYTVAGSAFALQGMIFNTEQALVVPALLALWCLVRWLDTGRWQSAAYGGAALGAVALIKPTAAPLLVLLLLLGLGRHRVPQIRRGVLAVLGGMAVPVLLVAGYFVRQGAWHDFVFALFTYNARYLADSIRMWNPGTVANNFAPVAPLLLLAWGGVALSFPGPGGFTLRRRQGLAVAGWTVAFVLAALAGLRPYVHYYYPALPGLALLAAPALVSLARQPLRQGVVAWVAHWSAVGGVALLTLLPLLVSTVQAAKVTPFDQASRLYNADGPVFADAQQTADWIYHHTDPDQPLFVWGAEPEIYWLAQRRPATRWLYDYPLGLFPQFGTELQQELQQRPPATVAVYTAIHPNGFDQFVQANHLLLLQRFDKLEVWGRAPAS